MSDYEQASVDSAISFHIDAASFSMMPPAQTAVPPQRREPAAAEVQTPSPSVSASEAPTDLSDRQSEGNNQLLWPSETIALSTTDTGTVSEQPQEPRVTANVVSDEALNIVVQEAATPAEVSAEAVESHAPIKPAWEVDQLRWPEICDRLLDQESEYFRHAGHKLFEASRQGLKVLAVTSSRRGEGCTTLSCCLARAVEATGARVLVIDADVQNPRLSATLGIDLPAGWLDVAAESTPWAEAAVASVDSELTVIPGKSPGSSPPPTAGIDRAASVLAGIAEHYDLVVLDIGPLANEARYLWAQGTQSVVDAAIVVRDCRQTSQESTLAVAAKLKALGVQAVGIAENYTSSQLAVAAA